VKIYRIKKRRRRRLPVGEPNFSRSGALWSDIKPRLLLAARGRTAALRIGAPPARYRATASRRTRSTSLDGLVHRSGLRERYAFPAQAVARTPNLHRRGRFFREMGKSARYRCGWSGWWIDYDEAALPPKETTSHRSRCSNGPRSRFARTAALSARLLKRAERFERTLFSAAFRWRFHAGPPPAGVGRLLCSRGVHFFYSHVSTAVT